MKALQAERVAVLPEDELEVAAIVLNRTQLGIGELQ